MTDTAHHLAALVASRLCHDLIGPIGAIGNGIELLSLDPRPKSAEIALLGDSIGTATSKLRFFRIAFGSATGEQTMGRMQVVPLLADLYRNSRIVVDWHSPTDMPRPEVRLAFLLLLCAEHAIPTGGNIVIRRDENGWHLSASSPRLRHDAALWSFLATPAAEGDLAASHVQFVLAGLALADQGRRATVDVGSSGLTVSF